MVEASQARQERFTHEGSVKTLLLHVGYIIIVGCCYNNNNNFDEEKKTKGK